MLGSIQLRPCRNADLLLLGYPKFSKQALLYKSLLYYMKSADLQMLETGAKHFNKKNISVGYQFATLQTGKMGSRGEEGHNLETTLHQLLPGFSRSSISKPSRTLDVFRKSFILEEYRGDVKL